MKSYRLRAWQRLREDTRDLDPGFQKHLRECVRRKQIAFQRMMAATNGNPVGVEFRRESSESWGFVLPDVAGDAPWRVQAFDADGFVGHNCYASFEDATEALINDGYRVIDAGALDRCSRTLRWALGVKCSELRLLFNLGKLTWTEMIERSQQAR